MAPEPLIPRPASQVYVAVDPSSVVEYVTAVGAFITIGGLPQSKLITIGQQFNI